MMWQMEDLNCFSQKNFLEIIGFAAQNFDKCWDQSYPNGEKNHGIENLHHFIVRFISLARQDTWKISTVRLNWLETNE